MIYFLIKVLSTLSAWVVEKTFLGKFFTKPQPVQLEEKMAQDAVNSPSQSQAVRELEDGKA